MMEFTFGHGGNLGVGNVIPDGGGILLRGLLHGNVTCLKESLL